MVTIGIAITMHSKGLGRFFLISANKSLLLDDFRHHSLFTVPILVVLGSCILMFKSDAQVKQVFFHWKLENLLS